MANLTLERRLVQALESARAEPGNHTVVLKEQAGGRTLHRVLPPGEPFHKGFLDFGRYEAYAVSASPVLRHRLNEQLKTGVGEGRDHFTVHVTVAFRVAQPGVLAERVAEDPLGLLDAEIRSLLRDWASTLSLETLADADFDAEDDFLHSRGTLGRAGEPSRFEAVQDLAAALGLEVGSLTLTREYSAADWDAENRVLEERRQRKIKMARHETDLLSTEHDAIRDAYRTLGQARVEKIQAGMVGVQSLVEQLDVALANVAKDTTTPRDLREAVRELVGAAHEMSVLLSPDAALAESPDRPALGPHPTSGRLPGAGGPLLVREVQRMVEVLQGLDCSAGRRTGVAGRILHVLAEICLASEARNGRLDEHAEELRRYCDDIEVEKAIQDPEQLRYLRRFREPENLRD
ncbi:MAG: hypothetical protein ACLF0P_01745, partial [Thermoanaerobaculia bacterium]